MKKILLIVQSLGIGGQERIAINTYESIREKYDVSFVVFQNAKVQYEHSFDVINLNIPASQNKIKKVINQIRRGIRLIKLRRKLKTDVAISFGTTANISNSLSGIFSRGKTVSAIHSFGSLKQKSMIKFILKHSDKVICIAKDMQQEVLREFPKASNTVVVENGYDVDKIVAESQEPLEQLQFKNTVVTMGRLAPVKAFDRLIKAFSVAKKSCPELNLVILGKGELLDTLQDVAKDEMVADSVHFLGYQKNPYAYLKHADLFVLSSLSEGFPNALIEALSCELPIVSLDCRSGPREILSEVYGNGRIKGIIEEKYGVLVEYSNIEAENVELLAQAIVRVMKNQDLRNKYIANAMERARQFSLEVYKEKLINLIDSM